MKKNIIITLLAATVLSSCGEYNKLLKSTDYEYKYEAAKNYFAKGQYNRSATLLNELITILKGGDKAEESLYMLAMSYYNQKDYSTAAQSFITYFNIHVVSSLNWLVFMQAKLCSWILRNPDWISQVLIRLSSSCRCSWNIILKAAENKRHRIWFLLCRISWFWKNFIQRDYIIIWVIIWATTICLV